MPYNEIVSISLLILVCIASVGVAVYIWSLQQAPGAREFLGMLAAIFIWSACTALELVSPTMAEKAFWRTTQQLGIILLPPTWLLFTFAYLDFRPWSRSRARWLLLIVPIVSFVMAATNNQHYLFFQMLQFDEGPPPMLTITPGQWYWLHIAYSYLCLISGLALIAGAFWNASPLFRQQAILIVIGLLFPFLTNWAYLSQITHLGVDLTPIAFLFSAPFIIVGLYRYRFLHIVPIARDHLIEVMADPMILIDRHGYIVDYNPAAQQLFSIPKQSYQLLVNVLPWPALHTVADTLETVRVELNCPAHPDRFFDITIVPVESHDGSLSGRLFVFREITERRQNEQRVKEALQRFTDIIEQTPLVAIQRFDRHGVILEWNRVCEQFYGYTAAEACNRRLQDLILSENTVAEFEQQIEYIWTTGRPIPPRKWQIHTKNGEERWLYSAMFPLFSQGQVSDIVCMDVDITDIYWAEENLRRQRDQLDTLYRLTLDWLNRRDGKDLLQAITDSAYRLLDVRYVELLLAEDDHTLVIRACTPPLPTHIARREGPASAPLSWRAFQSRQPEIVLDYTQWPERTPDYEPLNFGPAMTLPIIVGDECLGVIGMARARQEKPFSSDEIQHAVLLTQLAALVLDNANLYTQAQRELAERKQAEEQRAKLQAQLVQAQKMEAIGQLAGGIAHDFNNILTVITGSVELAMLEINPDHVIYPELEAIRQSAARASELVRQLLTFARRQPGQPQLVDVNRQINDTMNMMRRLIGEHIQLRLQLDEHIERVMIDPSQLEQVLINLVVNARDAMPNGGELTIRTTSQYLSVNDLPPLRQIQAGKYVLLSVCDTGVGIAEQIRPHIFEPYFTTKPMGQGSGLGLAICDGIVTQHGGFLTVDSQPGYGSCFTVALPAVVTELQQVVNMHTADAPTSMTGQEVILFVEDDPNVRQLGVRLLREHGYTVLEAKDANEALQLAQQYGNRVQILITDVVLPHTDGLTLAQQLQSVLPHLHIILMSGYLQRMLADGSTPPYPVLAKPFTRYQLLSLIRQTIDRVA